MLTRKSFGVLSKKLTRNCLLDEKGSPRPFAFIGVGARGIGSGHPQDYHDALSWGVKFYLAEAVHSNGLDPVLENIDQKACI